MNGSLKNLETRNKTIKRWNFHPGVPGRQEGAPQNRAPASALCLGPPRATVAMAFALAAAVWASSWSGATWLTERTRRPVATAPHMCATEKPEAPAPGGAKEGSAFSLHLRP